MQLDRKVVIEGLCTLNHLDRQRCLFGAVVHRYQLNPPIAARELDDFEQALQVTLPADYRYFLTHIGNGGAGPFAGLFPFGMHDDNADLCRWEDGFLVGDVKREFPHRTAWNLPDNFWREEPNPPPGTPTDEENRLLERWDQRLNESYWTTRVVDGSIPICHRGCALRQWLVITGPEHGRVWNDDRADNRGLYPVLDMNGRPLSFTDWYLTWLALATFEAETRKR